jgi:hypothetical protein
MMTRRTTERVLWLLRRMCETRHGNDGFIVAWDTYTVDDFVKAFPEAEKTLHIYFAGPNSSPMLNATAKRAEANGFVTPGHIGNPDARHYMQRTWCRTWRITPEGRAFLRRAS